MLDTGRNEIHLDDLHRSLEVTRARLARLVDTDLLAELVPIWKRPGWTTPAEFLLVEGMLTGIQHQIEGLERSIEVLVKGADVVAPR